MAVSGVCLFSQGAPYGCEWCPVCTVRELLMAVSGACLYSQGAPYGCEWCLFVQSGSSLWL